MKSATASLTTSPTSERARVSLPRPVAQQRESSRSPSCGEALAIPSAARDAAPSYCAWPAALLPR